MNATDTTPTPPPNATDTDTGTGPVSWWEYWVVFSHPHGTGAMTISRTAPINSGKAITEVTTAIARGTNRPVPEIVVTNWILLNTTTVPAAGQEVAR